MIENEYIGSDDGILDLDAGFVVSKIDWVWVVRGKGLRNLKIILQLLVIIGCIVILIHEYHSYNPKKRETNSIADQIRYYQMQDFRESQKPLKDKRYLQSN